MYVRQRQRQVQVQSQAQCDCELSRSGDDRGSCKLYLDRGRSEPVQPNTKSGDLWRKVTEYDYRASVLEIVLKDKIGIGLKTMRYCSLFRLYNHLHGPKCPAYEKSKGVPNQRTVSISEGVEDNDDLPLRSFGDLKKPKFLKSF